MTDGPVVPEPPATISIDPDVAVFLSDLLTKVTVSAGDPQLASVTTLILKARAQLAGST